MAAAVVQPRLCAVCGKPLVRPHYLYKACSVKCSRIKKLHDMREWHRNNKNWEVQYQITTRQDFNFTRRERRRQIQDVWGRGGGSGNREIWRSAENLAILILPHEGYANVRSLLYYKHAFFDIRAEKDGQIHVFQVTTRTHTGEDLRHNLLARDLGVEYSILYVKPSLTGYLIKRVGEPSWYEINLGDLDKIKTLPN